MSKNESERRLRATRRIIAIGMLGGRCVSCGIDDYRLLQISHINDNGYLDGNGSKLIARIVSGRRNLDGLELLCCNDHYLRTYHNGTN